MIIGSSGNDAIAPSLYSLSQRLRVLDNLLYVGLVVRLLSFQETNCLCCNDMDQRSTLGSWKDSSIQIFSKTLLTENHATTRPPQRFVRRGRDEIAMRHGTRMLSGCNQSRDMRHVCHQQGTGTAGRLSDSFKIDDSGICTGAD